MTRTPFYVALALALGLVAQPAKTRASPVLELTGGISGGGFNARIVGTGPESAYFNPSLLPLAPESFDVSFFVLGDNTTVTLQDRPAGSDVGDSIYEAWLGDGQGGVAPLESSPLATADLSERQGRRSDGGFRTYLGVGLSKQIVEDKIVFGMLLVLPTGDLQGQQVFYNDEREQYFSNSLRFELYEDRLDQMTFAFAAGGRLNEIVSVGVGFTAGIESTAQSPVFVPDGGDLSTNLINSDVQVAFKLSPHFGVTAQPTDRVRVAATLHTPNQVTISGVNEVQVANGTTELQTFEFVHGYEPLSINLASAVDVYRDKAAKRVVTAVATGTFRTWSNYRDRHGERPLDPWDDTLSAAVGGRYFEDDTVGYLDLTFVPSPVPLQRGRTNYVDNHRVSMTAGVRTLTTILGLPVKGGFQIQAHGLVDRSVTKSPAAANPVVDEFPDNAVIPTVDPSAFLPGAQGLQSNNPGFPGFSSSGWMFGAGLTLSTDF